MRSRRSAVLQILASALLFGTSGTAQALGPAGLMPLATSGTRLLTGALLLTALLPSMGHRLAELPQVLRSPMTMMAAAFACVFQAGYFISAHIAGVALGALVTMGSIPLMTGLAGVLLGHRVTVTWLGSTLICAAGLVLLGYQGVQGGSAAGVVAALVAAAGGAGFTLSLKHMLDVGQPALVAQAGVFLIAGSVMALVAALTSPLGWLLDGRGVALAAWLGLMTMALPNVLWIRGLGAVPPGTSATLLLAEPLTATVLGVARLHESLTGPSVVGIVAVIAGLAFLAMRESSTPVADASV